MSNISNLPVESVKIDWVKPYEKNHKIHTDKQIDELAKSIAENGIENPLLLEEDGTIISGHGRLMAALKLNWKVIPARIAKGIDKAQAKKLRIAVNKTTSTDYDTNILSLELEDLRDLDLSLEGMGFSEKELSVLLDDIGEIDVGLVSDNVVEQVQEYEEQTEKEAKKLDASNVPLNKVFTFKTVTVEQSRKISGFLMKVEEITGLEGAEALAKYAEDME